MTGEYALRPASWRLTGKERALFKIVAVAEFEDLCVGGGKKIPGHLTMLYISDWRGPYGSSLDVPILATHLAAVERVAREIQSEYDSFELRAGAFLNLDPRGAIAVFRERVERETGLAFRTTGGSDKLEGHVSAPFLPDVSLAAPPAWVCPSCLLAASLFLGREIERPLQDTHAHLPGGAARAASARRRRARAPAQDRGDVDKAASTRERRAALLARR